MISLNACAEWSGSWFPAYAGNRSLLAVHITDITDTLNYSQKYKSTFIIISQLFKSVDVYCQYTLAGPRHEETGLRAYADSEGPDQPIRQRKFIVMPTKSRLHQKLCCVVPSHFFHYENTSIQIYRKFHLQKNENFQIKKKNSDIFHTSAQNTDCGTRENRLGEAVLTSTHNLCFRAKIRKIMYTPVNPSFTI